MAAAPAALGRARGPEARNVDGGPQGRAGPARSPPCSRGPAAQPGPERARAAPQEPAAPGSAASEHTLARPVAPSVPAPQPRRRPRCPTARTSRPGRRLACSPPAPILRPLLETRLHGPPLSPPPGTRPAARSLACGGGGSCAAPRAPIAPIHEGQDSEQDGARLLARRLEGGTLRLMKPVHWSVARWDGATHVGP